MTWVAGSRRWRKLYKGKWYSVSCRQLGCEETKKESWQHLLRGVCQSGQMSEGRFDAYCRNIRVFVAWIGPETPIDALDEAELEGYFTHLSSQVGAEKYSPNYAHTLLMTAKQFISR